MSEHKYDPFRYGIECGSAASCEFCGAKSANDHGMGQAGFCDGVKRVVRGTLKASDVRNTAVLAMAARIKGRSSAIA